jgi:hypothetical protein
MVEQTLLSPVALKEKSFLWPKCYQNQYEQWNDTAKYKKVFQSNSDRKNYTRVHDSI